MKTVLELVTLSADFLKKKGIANSRRQAEELIGEALGMGRMDLYLQYDRPISEAELDRCREWLVRRSKGEPLQYIQGEVEFHGCRVKVNRHVLIPRQETEILVEKISEELGKQSLKGKVLWDICCGSGCIAIALKKRFPDLLVAASDISQNALEVAQGNAKQNETEIEFLQGDLLAPFQGRKADFLVCNPPYVADHEFAGLDIEVREHEPKLALIGGPTGLEFYRRIKSQLADCLHKPAKVWFEIGHGQGEALKETFSQPPFKNVCLENDWAGKERFFSLEIE